MNPQPEELDSNNKADTKPKPEDKYLWELDYSVMGQNKLDVNDTADDEGKWYINEYLDLA